MVRNSSERFLTNHWQNSVIGSKNFERLLGTGFRISWHRLTMFTSIQKRIYVFSATSVLCISYESTFDGLVVFVAIYNPFRLYCIYFLQADNPKPKPQFQLSGLQDGQMHRTAFFFTFIAFVKILVTIIPIGLLPKFLILFTRLSRSSEDSPYCQTKRVAWELVRPTAWEQVSPEYCNFFGAFLRKNVFSSGKSGKNSD